MYKQKEDFNQLFDAFFNRVREMKEKHSYEFCDNNINNNNDNSERKFWTFKVDNGNDN